jgi:hypothetical protein
VKLHRWGLEVGYLHVTWYDLCGHARCFEVHWFHPNREE